MHEYWLNAIFGSAPKKKKRTRRSLGENDILSIDDLGEEELKGDEENLIGDVFGDARCD